MFAIADDIKNFLMGGLDTGFNRAGRWGRWAFGYYGDEHNAQGQFQGFHIGSSIVIALMVATLAFGTPWMFLPTYIGMLVGATALGGATGFVQGGFSEMRDGQERRAIAEAEQAQQRDQSKLHGLQDKAARQQAELRQTVGDIGQTKERMVERQHQIEDMQIKRGGFAARELQRRRAAEARALAAPQGARE